MKTTADINALIPILVDLIRNNRHEIGEDKWSYQSNLLCYEEDGWYIEIFYRCAGIWDNESGDYWTPPCHDLVRAWGDVEEITACHYDEDTDEEVEFSEEELKELRNALDKELEDIA